MRHVREAKIRAGILHKQLQSTDPIVARAADARTPVGPSVDTERFFRQKMSPFWNRWFTTYAEARESLAQVGGYLFPFRDQFFVCETGFVEALGADPADQDWARIGFDWVEPADAAAYERLTRRLVELGYGSVSRDVASR